MIWDLFSGEPHVSKRGRRLTTHLIHTLLAMQIPTFLQSVFGLVRLCTPFQDPCIALKLDKWEGQDLVIFPVVRDCLSNAAQIKPPLPRRSGSPPQLVIQSGSVREDRDEDEDNNSQEPFFFC